MVARFRSVMVGFGGGHLDVGWVSRWRSGLRLGFWVSVVSWSQFLCLNSNCGWYGEWWRRGLNWLGVGYDGDRVMGHDMA